MKKSILNLGAQELTKNEQKNVTAGGVGTKCFGANPTAMCGTPPAGTVYRCINGKCKLELLGGV